MSLEATAICRTQTWRRAHRTLWERRCTHYEPRSHTVPVADARPSKSRHWLEDKMCSRPVVPKKDDPGCEDFGQYQLESGNSHADEQGSLIDQEAHRAHRENQCNFVMPRKARPTFKHVPYAQRIIDRSSGDEREYSDYQVVETKTLGKNGKQPDVNARRHTANKEVANDPHRNALYFTMQ